MKKLNESGNAKNIKLNVFSELITGSQEILEELFRSKQFGNIIGISAENMGAGMFLTAVDDILIIESMEPLIVLKSYDVSGYFFETNRIYLNQIQCVFPFKSEFKNPFLDKVKQQLLKNEEDNSTTSSVDSTVKTE